MNDEQFEGLREAAWEAADGVRYLLLMERSSKLYKALPGAIAQTRALVETLEKMQRMIDADATGASVTP